MQVFALGGHRVVLVGSGESAAELCGNQDFYCYKNVGIKISLVRGLCDFKISMWVTPKFRVLLVG